MKELATDLVTVDDILPSSFSPFRTLEYAHYLHRLRAELLSLEGWHHFVGPTTFEHELAELPVAPALKKHIHRFTDWRGVDARLAYLTFLLNAERILPWLEERHLPFILQLYPGGKFWINVPETDRLLERVLLSPFLRRVIVTQTVTHDYVRDVIGCPAERIVYLYGGVFESRNGFDFRRDKRLFPRDKSTLDVCFVAHRYFDNITAKGWDLFVAIAQELAHQGSIRVHDVFRFHVVGDYRPDDVALGGLTNLFTFHGRQPTEFFRGFYPTMDLIVPSTGHSISGRASSTASQPAHALRQGCMASSIASTIRSD